MKTLTLVRHAKSSWKQPALQDYDRPLNARGRRDLPGLAQRLSKQVPRPQRLIHSGSVRTQLTSQPLIQAWHLQPNEIRLDRRLYEAALEQLLQVIQEQENTCQHLLLVGHNPGLAELSHYLTGQPLPHFPTAAFAHLLLQVPSWNTLTPSSAELKAFDYPKLHL